MDASMAHGAERVLENTLQDLQIRSEVEATMQSMLVDVELAANLQKDLALQSQLTELKERALQDESALKEARAMQSQQKEHQVSLADTLVKELWTLSRELGELQRWKQTHETTVLEHDELLAKLLQAEEQIRELESRPATSFVGEAAAKDPADFIVPEPHPVPNTAIHETTAIENEANEFLSTTPGKIAVEEDGYRSEPAEPDNTAAADTDDDAVVALLQEEEGDAPSLDMLDMTILTHIFEFLDALEILSTAQVNVTMYSRVDALFGFGAGADQVEESAPPASVDVSTRVPSSTSSSTQSPTQPGSSNPSMYPAQSRTVPTKMPPQSSSNASSKTDSPRRGGIFSLLHSRGVAVSRRAAATTEQPLSAAMTDSMVAKLTDKELSAIFSLTEKLHHREKALAALTKEKEELAGKLEGTEALKEFLIIKVRDVERSLKKSQEDETKVTQQIASDQEVIAFLDSRVQELERTTKALTIEKKAIAEELTRVQEQNEKKITVLSDMLQFERERVSENEREWKATKKLLVKEIKSCRAQLVALQAERDGFREQNERLRKAVLSPN